MIWLGTGPIKGFGVTLAIGVISTLISVLITAHLHHGAAGRFRHAQEDDDAPHRLKDLHVDFVKYGKPAFIGSVDRRARSASGVIAYKGSAIYGIDFAGGDVDQRQFTRAHRHRQDPSGRRGRQALARSTRPTSAPIGGGNATLKIETARRQIRTNCSRPSRRPTRRRAWSRAARADIGASIGKEIELECAPRRRRFDARRSSSTSRSASSSASASVPMVSTLHDILMTIGIFVLFGHQFSRSDGCCDSVYRGILHQRNGRRLRPYPRRIEGAIRPARCAT